MEKGRKFLIPPLTKTPSQGAESNPDGTHSSLRPSRDNTELPGFPEFPPKNDPKARINSSLPSFSREQPLLRCFSKKREAQPGAGSGRIRRRSGRGSWKTFPGIFGMSPKGFGGPP